MLEEAIQISPFDDLPETLTNSVHGGNSRCTALEELNGLFFVNTENYVSLVVCEQPFVSHKC